MGRHYTPQTVERLAPDTGTPAALGKGIVRGAAETALDPLRTYDIARADYNRALLEEFDRIDRLGDQFPARPEFLAKPEVSQYRLATPEQRAQMRAALQGQTDPRQMSAFQAAEAGTRAVQEAVPATPEEQARTSYQLGSGIGSTGAFFVTGAAGRALRIPTLPTVAGTGALVNASQQFQEALASGASIEDATDAAEIGATVGLSEAFPIANMLDRLDRLTGGGTKRVIVNALKEGSEEAIQEATQAIANNLIASDLVAYDPEREMFQGAGENAGIGFTVGSLASFLISAAGRRAGGGGLGEVQGPPAQEIAREALSPERAGETTQAPAQPPIASAPVVSSPIRETAGAATGTFAEPQRVSVEDVERVLAGAPAAAPAPMPAPAAPPLPPAPLEPPTGQAPPAGGPTRVSVEDVETALAHPGSVAITPRGRQIEFSPEVVELDSLIASQNPDMSTNPDFPADLQPRRRERAASQTQIAEIASRLEPELLGIGASATDGAPIVGPDGIVESGNARTLALRRAYAENLPGAERYRASLRSQGYDVEGMRRPVLIRRRVSDLSPEDRQAFVREANERTTLSMSATEQAAADAAALPENLLEMYQGGSLNSAANREFVRRFAAAAIPASERGNVFAADGSLSQDGLRRVENALFAKAFGDPAILEALREDTDTNIKAIGGALIDAAPAWARMRAVAPPGLDITDQVLAAVHLVSRARRQGVPVSDLLAQTDAFAAPIAPETVAVLTAMFTDERMRRPASRDRVAGALRYYADQAGRAQAGGGLDLGLAAVQPVEILRLSASRGAGDLFGDAPALAARSGGGRAMRVSEEPLASRAGGPGARYRGMIAAPFDPDVPRISDVQRRETILRDLMRALGVPLYQGRIKGKARLGFYRPGREEVRVKRRSDLEVTAHEIAHLLDDRIPEIRKQWRPATKANKAIRDELRGVSYDKGKLYEGFAEFVRLWMTQPAEAAARAPKFSAWFDGFVERSEYGPALTRSRDQMTAWFAQNAIDRARSKVGETADINEWLATPRHRFRQSVVDDLHGIKLAERTLSGQIKKLGMYETARLARGAGGILEGALAYGAPQFQGKDRIVFIDADGNPSTLIKGGKIRRNPDYRRWGLTTILRPIASAGELEDFGLYAIGRRAEELKRQGRENLFTKAEIDGMVSLERPSFVKAFEEWNAFNKQILDFAEQAGVINPFSRKQWESDVYLPFYRVDTKTHGRSAAKGVPGMMQPIVRLRGGTANIGNPIENMFQNTRMLVETAVLNEARRTVVKEIMSSAGSGRFLARIPTDTLPVKVLREQVEREFWKTVGLSYGQVKAGNVPEEYEAAALAFEEMPDWVTFWLVNQAPRGANVLAVMNAGKPSFYEVADPLLWRALAALPRNTARHGLIDFMRFVKNVSQFTVTASLDFMWRNIVRDQAMAATLNKYGYRPFIESARGFKAKVTGDPLYQEWLANGGALASFWSDAEDFHRNLRQFYERRSIPYALVVNTPRKMLHLVESIMDATEAGTRIGAFRRAVAAGVPPRSAAFESREISTDFAMRVDDRVLNFFYDSVMFLKAGVVGVERAYRGVTDDPNRARVAMRLGVIATLSAVLYLINRDNPLYEELEDWDRDVHWHFFIPTPEAIEHYGRTGRMPDNLNQAYLHFRLPKPWEVGAVGSIAERTMAAIVEPMDRIGDQGWSMLRIVMEAFRFADPRQLVPQVAAPLAEQWANRLLFFDRPIETPGMESLEPWARSGPTTSRTLRAWGEDVVGRLPKAARDLIPDAIESPARLEALLRGYFNTWAAYGLMLSDAMFFDDTPDLRVDQMPGLRSFYRQHPSAHSKFTTQFYDMLREATEARRTMREMTRRYRPEQAVELAATPENLAYGQLTRAGQAMRTMRRQIAVVQEMRDLAELQRYAASLARDRNLAARVASIRNSQSWKDIGALKRDLIDLWLAERNRLAKETVESAEMLRRAS